MCQLDFLNKKELENFVKKELLMSANRLSIRTIVCKYKLSDKNNVSEAKLFIT